MLLRLLSPAFLPILLVGGAYSASPMLAAYKLHESIRAGDIATVEQRVDWASVRDSLRGSLKERIADLKANAGKQPTMWKRFKARLAGSVAPMFLGRVLDRQVTPATFVDYLAAKKKIDPWLTRMKRRLAGLDSQDAAAMPPERRGAGMLDRVKRASFVSLTRFAIEVGDKFEPSRSYEAVMELRDFEWKLTEVRVLKR